MRSRVVTIVLVLAPAAVTPAASAQCDPTTILAPQPRIPLISGSSPWEVRAADLDADGNQDLVVTQPGTRTVAVFLGNGDGTFQTPTRYGVNEGIGVNPMGLVIVDVNGDALLDLCVGNATSNSVTVLSGDGLGGFQLWGVFDAGFFVQPRDIAAADLDADGDTDLVVSSEANQVRVLINDGSGIFAPPVFTVVFGSVSSVELADLNGDTIPDVAVTDFVNAEIEVALGNGAGGFGGFVAFPAQVSPADIHAADMDNDGDLDLVVCGFFGEISIFLNPGNASFLPRTDYPALGAPRTLAIDDLDADGIPDVLAATNSTNPQTISLFLGGPAGTLGNELTFEGFNGASSVALADFNNDGAPDGAAVFEASNDMRVYLNTCPAACVPDFAPPQGTLNFFDVAAFIAAFNAMDPAADLAPPSGVFNFFDIAEFVTLYNAGCP